MKKVIRLLFFATIIVALLFSCYLFWRVWQNNLDTSMPSHTEIKQHFEQSVNWIDSNYASVENIKNPILWWMIKQAAKNSNNKMLNDVFLKYKNAHLDNEPPNLSTPMFDKFYRPRMPSIEALSGLQPYQTFFFYALSCNDELSSEPIIQQQMNPGFCSLHYLHPRCIAHQLMGLRFMQRYQCGYDEIVSSTVHALQQDVISELTWDFRVGDAYIQRVLMMVDSGAYEQVKPVWINHVLAAQNEDGSWDDLDPVLGLGDNKTLGFTSMLPKIGTPKADFHATAQGIWLLSLLLEEAGETFP